MGFALKLIMTACRKSETVFGWGLSAVCGLANDLPRIILI